MIYYTYDNNNNYLGAKCEEFSEGSSVGKIIEDYSGSAKYIFDSHGNWIEQVEYQNGKPSFIIKRKIFYKQIPFSFD